MMKNFFSKVTENQSVMTPVGGGYKSPEVKVLTFQPEGVLCASVNNGHDGFVYDDEEIL